MPDLLTDLFGLRVPTLVACASGRNATSAITTMAATTATTIQTTLLLPTSLLQSSAAERLTNPLIRRMPSLGAAKPKCAITRSCQA